LITYSFIMLACLHRPFYKNVDFRFSENVLNWM